MRTTFITTTLAAFAIAFNVAAQPQGSGPGGGPGMQGGCCNANTTPGWAMMTPEERTAHRDRVMGSKDYAGCSAYMQGHYKAMEQRAKERGTTMPDGPGGMGPGGMGKGGMGPGGTGGPGPACDFLKK